MSLTNIGRYRIDAVLGKGAMGMVYKATDPMIGRTVALKTMRVDVHGIESEDMLRRIRNEARAAGALSHPNLVTIYDANEVDGLFYIAMEYLEGQTLAELMVREGLPSTDRLLDVMKQVCSALDYAHAHGIVHRDIKPANIMLTRDGRVKIMDFGIAKCEGNLTNSGQVLGTPNYMSPEQVKGKPLDGRSDVFSLGVVLYELLTGERPFHAQNVTTIIYKIVNEQPIPPTELEQELDPGLNAAVMRALAKDREQRYQSCGELLRDLELCCDAPAEESCESDQHSTAIVHRGGEETTSLYTSTVKPKSHSQKRGPWWAARVPRRVRVKRMLRLAAIVLAAFAGLGAAAVGARKFTGAFEPTGAVQAKTTTEQPDFGLSVAESAQQEARESTSNPKPLGLGSLPAGSPAQPATSPESAQRKVETQQRSKNDSIASTTAKLRVSSDPAGAEVFVDGRASGKQTPAELEVGTGIHAVTVKKAGFQDGGDVVGVANGRPALVALSLAPKKSKRGFGRVGGFFSREERVPLAINSTPPGAQVYLNGRRLENSTPLRTPVPEGIYNLDIVLEGYRTVEKRVKVERGSAVSIQESLRPIKNESRTD